MEIKNISRNHPFQRERGIEHQALDYLSDRGYIQGERMIEVGHGFNFSSGKWFKNKDWEIFLVDDGPFDFPELKIPKLRLELLGFPLYVGSLLSIDKMPMKFDHVHLWGMWASDDICIESFENWCKSIFKEVTDSPGIKDNPPYDIMDFSDYKKFYEQISRMAFQTIAASLRPYGTCLYVSATYGGQPYENKIRERKDGEHILRTANDFFREAVVFSADDSIDAILFRK